MSKYLNILLSFCILAFLGFGFSVLPNITIDKSVLMHSDTEQYTGKVVQKQFINKGGKPIAGVNDYYFKHKRQLYFIKFCESHVSADRVKELMDQKVVVAAKIITDGLWDSCDEPYEVQSRMGAYIVLESIEAK